MKVVFVTLPDLLSFLVERQTIDSSFVGFSVYEPFRESTIFFYHSLLMPTFNLGIRFHVVHISRGGWV